MASGGNGDGTAGSLVGSPSWPVIGQIACKGRDVAKLSSCSNVDDDYNNNDDEDGANDDR
jgi:hypothetical protein